MKGAVDFEVNGELAVMTIINPPVNTLSNGVRQGIFDGTKKALDDGAVKAIVLTGSGRAFIAGADIAESASAAAEAPSLQECCRLLESSEKPIIAAINNTAFGGGLEIALCCDYRVASPGAPVGLPESKIGILPGAGGTQRLPRLIGAEQALKYIISGDPIPAPTAVKLGIVDEVIDGDLLEGAMAYARKIISEGGKTRKVRDKQDWIKIDRENKDLFTDAIKHASRRMRNRFAPKMIVKCVEAAVHCDDFDRGLELEQEYFMKCFNHPERDALFHVFFAQREVAKIPDVPKDTETSTIETAAVIGGGTMGGGIAMCFANAGIPVTILEMNQEALDRGLAVIKRNYDIQATRGRMTGEEVDRRMGLISGTLQYADLGAADIIIEAVYENIELKVNVFSKIDSVAKPGAILASNTSGLDIDKMANATNRPKNVIGLHFFSPANVMKLLEVVRGSATGKTIIATAMKLGKMLGKIAVLSGNAPGFIGNRILESYLRESAEIILQGGTPYQVDNVMTSFGLSMGPFQMYDLVGLDLAWRARKLAGVKPEDAPITVRVADQLCEMGRYGQKTSRGYYLYPEGSRVGQPDSSVIELVEKTSKELGITRVNLDDEEILKRCLYSMINEAARVLEEKIAIRSCDIDIVYLNGYGFPETTGGPLFWADQQGLDNILSDIHRFHEKYGDSWKPAPLLEKLVSEGKNFASYTHKGV